MDKNEIPRKLTQQEREMLLETLWQPNAAFEARLLEIQINQASEETPHHGLLQAPIWL